MRQFAAGNTLAEYAIILGLVTIVGAGGVQLLGGNVKGLYVAGNQKTQSSDLERYTAFNFKSESPSSNADGTADKSGETSHSVVNDDHGPIDLTNNSSSESNATSIENTTAFASASASAVIEKNLPFLQGQEQAKAQQLESLLNGMALAQGDRNAVPGLTVDTLSGTTARTNNEEYNKGSQIRDIYNANQQIKEILTNLSSSTASPAMAQIIAATKTALAKAQPDIALANAYIKNGTLNLEALKQKFNSPPMTDVSTLTDASLQWHAKTDVQAIMKTSIATVVDTVQGTVIAADGASKLP